jgi:hypothetical protein
MVRGKAPSLGLLRRPPSPHGRGKKSAGAGAPSYYCPLPWGEGGGHGPPGEGSCPQRRGISQSGQALPPMPPIGVKDFGSSSEHTAQSELRGPSP